MNGILQNIFIMGIFDLVARVEQFLSTLKENWNVQCANLLSELLQILNIREGIADKHVAF